MTCEMEHDKCRRTVNYITAGQNLAIFGSKPNFRPIEEAIEQSVQNWYDEYKLVPNLQEVEKLGSSGTNFMKIGHWCQLVQAKANRVGCSIVQFTDEDGWKQILIGCNYSAGNMRGYPIYSFGAPASLCTTGRNPKYPGLCSEKEDYFKHINGNLYYNNKAVVSPAVNLWLKNGKKIVD